MQTLSDVPLGAFLSGGIDSSLICSLMQKQSSVQIETCSIGFENKKFNEAEHARMVAKHLGTKHYEVYVNGKDALDVVPLLPKIYDEPFADSSQIPTYLVSKIAKQNVTVALTGDGGDELFGGYNRYVMADKYWKYLSSCPMALRRAFSYLVNIINPNYIDLFFQPFLKK